MSVNHTGMIRQVDDLGRIVIPKEVRRALRIKEGMRMEILTEHDRGIFQPYRATDTVSAGLRRLEDTVIYDSETQGAEKDRLLAVLRSAITEVEKIEQNEEENKT